LGVQSVLPATAPVLQIRQERYYLKLPRTCRVLGRCSERLLYGMLSSRKA
jgi:hypothetical protein